MIATAFEGFKRVWPEMPDRVAAEADNRMQVFDLLGALSVVRDWEMQVRSELTRRWLSVPVIPTGGMALTAEQVEDVRLIVWSEGDIADAAYNRLRALFPAAEPAEERCQKWAVRVAGGIETGIQCVLPAGHECFHYYVQPIHNYVHPAPAEPAEEETNLAAVAQEPRRFDPAVHRCLHGRSCICEDIANAARATRLAEPAEEETKTEALTTFLEGVLDYDSADMGWHLPGDWDPTDLADAIVHAPTAFSPVVPAPTETEWPTWHEVPEGRTVLAKNRHTYTKRDGILCIGTSTMKSCMATSTQHLAPFVAAEEG